MNKRLTRYAWLSLAAAATTIGLKGAAYYLTGSVSLLSDAMESFVNLAGAMLALAMLTIAARPPDDDHAYGHGKAEYFSSGAEGTMIMVAAGSIALAAIHRLLNPQPLELIGVGLVITAVATLINLFAALAIRRAAQRHDSVTLAANASHLMTDVWTSGGVILAVALVALTGWQPLDPIVALLVAANIVREGVQIVRTSISGLMDASISSAEQKRVEAVLDGFTSAAISYHALRTRQAGRRRFVSVHILVPGNWTVHDGHALLERIEAAIRKEIPHSTVLTHLESLEDPASFEDIGLDRKSVAP